MLFQELRSLTTQETSQCGSMQENFALIEGNLYTSALILLIELLRSSLTTQSGIYITTINRSKESLNSFVIILFLRGHDHHSDHHVRDVIVHQPNSQYGLHAALFHDHILDHEYDHHIH